MLVGFILLLTISICQSFDDYLIDSPKCKIPNFTPFSDEISSIFESMTYTPCNNHELLTQVRKVNNNLTTLEIRPELIALYTDKEIECCISKVSRNGSGEFPDVGFRLSKCIKFETSIALENGPTMVVCKEKPTKNLIYYNVHNVIMQTESIEKKSNKFTLETKPISVLFIVVDSVSRLNLIRTMPKTRTFLLENNFVEFEGYNKIDDNTFPNFMALLTGFNIQQSYEECNPKKKSKLDSCPMIWYQYRDLGYITAYAEDDAEISTFNYYKKGFTLLPTDLYFKPYIEAAEYLNSLQEPHENNHSTAYCSGPETSGERILNLAQNFVNTFKKSATFSIFWMNTFSHNYINSPLVMDEKVYEFFQNSFEDYKDSVVVYLSDHGIRFGDIRATKIGWFEERLPFFLMRLPNWFRQKFPTESQNFLDNSKKLTSTYDLYMTLQHILKLSNLDYEEEPSRACKTCSSLFRKIPDRSCEEAGIPWKWCTCIGHLTEIDENSDLIQNATRNVIEMLNRNIRENNFLLCTPYTVERIINPSVSQSINSNSTRNLFFILDVSPKALFLVTVQFTDVINKESIFHIVRHYDKDHVGGNGLCVESLF